MTSPDGGKSKPTVAARVGEGEITVQELDAYLKDAWFAENASDPNERYEMRREGIESLIDQQIAEAEAKRRGVTVAALLESEAAKLAPVTEAEIDQFYQDNRERIRSDHGLEALRPKIRLYLSEERKEQVIAGLRANTEVEIAIRRPRYVLPSGGASRGPEDAPVKIIVFSDYQCPYCKRAEGTIATLLERYPNQIQITYRHLPLDFHPHAREAALAAVCTEAQGKFWEYHQLLFASQLQLDRETLTTYAETLGLGAAQLEACMDAEQTNQRVDEDVRLALAAGATSTPTFFVNGIQMRGAQPVENFEKVIQAELAQSNNRPE